MIAILLHLPQAWRDLSVSKKLFFVVGLMGFLIAFELFSLRFAMHTLSSVRAFVGGEGGWSKAQKTAVLNLEMYARTRDAKYYQLFKSSLKVPLGDRIAREEFSKAEPDFARAREGFLQGEVHPDDIAGVIELIVRFHEVPYLKEALKIWSDANVMLDELLKLGERVHWLITNRAHESQIRPVIAQIDELNARLTPLEADFSDTLGAGSRWLEALILKLLLIAVFAVESTGVLLTLSFSRTLSRGLKQLVTTTKTVGSGDFSPRLEVKSRDELGQLASALNEMTAQLEMNVGRRQEAERASQEKSSFLANMSHEIRTPLGAILGFSELLRDETLSIEDREQFFAIIRRTGTNLSHIINDILDLSKVEAGKIELEPTSVALPEFLTEIRDVIRTRCAEKPVSIDFEPEGEVPERILTDPFRLRQILMNLLSNSIKFTSRGWIRMTYEVRGDKLAFIVNDTGSGLAKDEAEALFEAFVQPGRAHQPKTEGTGLGLVLSRRFAELLGGNVWLEDSQPGRGSTFIAEIALVLDEQTQAKLPLAPARSARADELRGRKVLVVEDTPENQLLISRLLEKRGAHVTLAANGREGLDRALSADFDIVLMDIQMPVMDGYTAIRELRETYRYAGSVLALTAHAMKEDRARCLEAGFDDYLTKPIEPEKFFATIAKFLPPLALHETAAPAEISSPSSPPAG